MADVGDRPGSWPVVGSSYIHEDPWVIKLREDTVHRPEHPEPTFRRLVVEHPGAAVVLAVDDQERVCCIRQYRHAAQATLIELPAGICDVEGEDPQRTAERELREEVELQAGSWRHLMTLNPSAGITTELHHLYLARDLSHADRGDFEMHAEEAELEQLWVPVDELVDAVLAGRIQESPMTAALLAYDVLRRRGEL